MTYADQLDTDILTFLQRHERKELLRFVTVGSVDDGKSTLIGRLLHDTHGVYDDQLKDASRGEGGEIDFALITDGLRAEREQGITIDVAYRYFTTPRRKFIIADTPGHVQYTRNMATGASTADVAIILIDARLGVLPQSRRHAFIASLLGIPHLLVAINKMDLVGWDGEVFERIQAEFNSVSDHLAFRKITYLPISALRGDNIVEPSTRTPWYTGPTLLGFLEHVELGRDVDAEPLRLPIQTVIRPHLDYRGFAGQLASGAIKRGDPIKVLPSGRTSRVKAIDTFHGEIDEAFAPMSITLRLEDEIDISRGDILVHPGQEPRLARHLRAHIVWMHDAPLELGRHYLLKHANRYLRVQPLRVAWRLDMETLEHLDADRLDLNDIGEVTLAADRPLSFDPYADNRLMGAFIVIDMLANTTVGAGMLIDADREHTDALAAHNAVTPHERALRLGHRAAVAWLHGPQATERAETLQRLLFDRGILPAIVCFDREQQPLDLIAHLAAAGLLVLAVAPTPQTLHEAQTTLPHLLHTPLDPEHTDAQHAEDLLALTRA